MLEFDAAFKPSTDDIARGDTGLNAAEKRKPKPYTQLGRQMNKAPIDSLEKYLLSERMKFYKRFTTRDKDSPYVKESDFVYVRTLGSGSFGVVTMVKKVDDGVYYARKMMTKQFIISNKKLAQTECEKKILESVRFPFALHMKFFYQDKASIYYITPVVAGGELYEFIRRVGRVRERIAKFISAQIVMALEYLHAMGVMHRDLKLENVLIDHVGYIKLSDFGLGKYIQGGRTYTVCGTPEYMAPEVINNKGYGRAADWWSFGIIIYELCNGTSPFYASEIIDIFYLITQNMYKIPNHFSMVFAHLIKNLLQTELSKRLGNLKNGVKDIKQHMWYHNTPWLALLNRKVWSPIVPIITDGKSDFFKAEKEPARPQIKADLYEQYFKNF